MHHPELIYCICQRAITFSCPMHQQSGGKLLEPMLPLHASMQLVSFAVALDAVGNS
jgi:hypothetical protein